MEEPVRIVVEQLPNGVGTLLQVVSGVLVPVILLLASWKFSQGAERRAKTHSENLWEKGVILGFLERSHDAMERLYVAVQNLRLVNLRRERLEHWADEVGKVNDRIIRTESELAKSMHQENLWRITERLWAAEQAHAESIVEVRTAFTRLQIVVSKELADEVGQAVDEICEVARESGSVTQESVACFATSLSKLSRLVESDPKQCMAR